MNQVHPAKNGHKASFSSSPLARPKTPIHRLAARVQDYLYLPDPYPLYTLIASLVANYASGRPVWLLFVGPPSCGKTELLRSLVSLVNVFESGPISCLGALLSGTKRRERARDATGGLLRQIGRRGCLVIKEFGSILSLQRDALRQIVGALREIYDGSWTRPIGTDGGRTEHWEGKMGLLSGATEAIDAHHSLIAELGERFIYYRYPQSEGWSEADRALALDGETLTTTLQALVTDFADEIGLDWEVPPPLEDLSRQDTYRIIPLAQIAANGRASVSRDPYSKEITNSYLAEYPTRLCVIFGQLLRSLRYIGVGEADSWRILRKVAFDSIPNVRRSILFSLLPGPRPVSEIVTHIGVSNSTIRRALEELAIYQLVVRDSSDWSLSPWMRSKLQEAWIGTNGHGRH